MTNSLLKKDLTVTDMYKAKQQLEQKLFQAIKNFEDITGCLIIDMNFTFPNKDDDDEDQGYNEANGLELDVRLSNSFYQEATKK